MNKYLKIIQSSKNGIYRFKTKQQQCTIDPKQKKKNLLLVTALIIVLGLGIFLSLEKWSSWYFDAYVVPAQKKELNSNSYQK